VEFCNKEIKAIIFDCYGTIIDTGNSSINATKEILKKHNLDINADEFYLKWKVYQRKYFDNTDNFFNQEDIFLITLKELYEEYHIEGNPSIDVKIMLDILGRRVAFPESVRIINLLRDRYKIYIASLSDDKPITCDLTKNNILVDGVFTSESLKVYKPNKNFFYQVLNNINLKANDVIYIGDSPYDDILGPMSVGIKTIWVNRKNYNFDTKKFKPNYIVENLIELADIL